MILIGIISYGAQMLNIYAYSWGEASMLASLDYVRLLYATFFGWLIFETLPGPYTWIGALVIIAASLVHGAPRTQGQRQFVTQP